MSTQALDEHPRARQILARIEEVLSVATSVRRASGPSLDGPVEQQRDVVRRWVSRETPLWPRGNDGVFLARSGLQAVVLRAMHADDPFVLDLPAGTYLDDLPDFEAAGGKVSSPGSLNTMRWATHYGAGQVPPGPGDASYHPRAGRILARIQELARAATYVSCGGLGPLEHSRRSLLYFIDKYTPLRASLGDGVFAGQQGDQYIGGGQLHAGRVVVWRVCHADQPYYMGFGPQGPDLSDLPLVPADHDRFDLRAWDLGLRRVSVE